MINELYENGGECLKASLVNKGDMRRVRAVLERAERGEPITLGFLGGSITAGSGSGDSKNYVQCVTDHFRESFPGSEITCVNAGIGATGSILGVFRMEKDVLNARPDILIIDHSVNDNGDEARVKGSTRETYECVIRRGLLSGAAVVPLCVCDRGGNSQREMNLEIAKHYDLPFVSMVDGIFEPLIKSGKHQWEDYSGDSVHPNGVGHAMLGELLWHYFETAMAEDAEPDSKHGIPNPLFGDSYMNTEFFTGTDLVPETLGSFQVGNTDFWQFKGGWLADGSSAPCPMVFSLKACKKVHLAFMRDPSETVGRVKVTVNGNTLELNAHFPGGWGRYAETVAVFSSDIADDVTVNVAPVEEGKVFSLLRVLVAK